MNFLFKKLNKQQQSASMNIHIPQESVLSLKRVTSLGAWLVVSGMLLLPGNGIAQVVTMNDGGSSATIDLGSSAGMNNWSVLGQSQLNQQWFWYRTDGGVAQPINTIGGLTYQTYSGDTGINEVVATYQNSLLSIEIDYILSGGGVGSGNADITETIAARNLSGSNPLSLNLYEYSNFNLLQSGNNSITIFGNPGAYFYVTQTSGSTALSEAIVSPYANYAEAANYNQTLNELNTLSGLVLNDNASAGPGNVTWAFQWDQTIAAGDQLDIFKDKNLSILFVPEPSTVAIIAMGAGALGLALRRKLS
jgi:hypothetical protein